MLQNLQNVANFQKCQLDNLVDFEKCCKTRIYLQKSAPIQPKTSEILPKFCQNLATTLCPSARCVQIPQIPVERLVGCAPTGCAGLDGQRARKSGGHPVVSCLLSDAKVDLRKSGGHPVVDMFTGFYIWCKSILKHYNFLPLPACWQSFANLTNV